MCVCVRACDDYVDTSHLNYNAAACRKRNFGSILKTVNVESILLRMLPVSLLSIHPFELEC